MASADFERGSLPVHLWHLLSETCIKHFNDCRIAMLVNVEIIDSFTKATRDGVPMWDMNACASTYHRLLNCRRKMERAAQVHARIVLAFRSRGALLDVRNCMTRVSKCVSSECWETFGFTL